MRHQPSWMHLWTRSCGLAVVCGLDAHMFLSVTAACLSPDCLFMSIINNDLRGVTPFLFQVHTTCILLYSLTWKSSSIYFDCASMSKAGVCVKCSLCSIIFGISTRIFKVSTFVNVLKSYFTLIWILAVTYLWYAIRNVDGLQLLTLHIRLTLNVVFLGDIEVCNLPTTMTTLTTQLNASNNKKSQQFNTGVQCFTILP